MIAQAAREAYDDFDSRIGDTAFDAAHVTGRGWLVQLIDLVRVHVPGEL